MALRVRNFVLGLLDLFACLCIEQDGGYHGNRNKMCHSVIVEVHVWHYHFVA